MKALTEPQKQALLDVADGLRVDPKALAALIQFESGWNPQAKNPTSSARGLIQFMNSTARGMGYHGGSAELVSKNPTIEAQLIGPVLNYLMPYSPFHDTPPCLPGQALFLAVFYPAARHWHPDDTFPETVIEANPGINSPRDYVEHVWRRAGEIKI